jgi:hypothetical protein
MEQKHKTWAIRAGVGVGVCALLTAWMVPDTTPTARPSVIAGMAGTAEAQKPTYSAVPDSAIPSWAAGLQQVPAAPPAVAAPPTQLADAGTMPDADAGSPPASMPAPDQAAPMDGAAPAPAVAEIDAPPPPAAAPAPPDGYQARRAQWQAQLDTTMAGQRGPS